MKNNSRIITIFIFVVLCGSLKAQSPSTIISELKSLLETYNVELTDRWNSNTYSYQYYKTVYTYNIDYAAPIITFTCNWTRKESTCTYYGSRQAKFDILKSTFHRGAFFKHNGWWSECNEKRGLTVRNESGIDYSYYTTNDDRWRAFNSSDHSLTEQCFFAANDIISNRIQNALLQLKAATKDADVEKSRPTIFEDVELFIDSIVVSSPSGKALINANETGCITAYIRNNGEYYAGDLDCIIKEKESTGYFVFESYNGIESIKGKTSFELRIPIKVSGDCDNGENDFLFTLKSKGKVVKTLPFTIKTKNKSKIVPAVAAKATNQQGTKVTYKTITMQKMEGNTYMLPCKVNGLPINFIFDTGASSVTLSKKQANFMLKNGYLKRSNIRGKQNYQTANGSISTGTVITIEKIVIGGVPLYNVEATIIDNDNAPLLLGQSALSKLGKIQIDYKKSTLTIIK